MSGATARVAAQAKVNLFLRLLARERSGYHQLETLFARLDLADDIVVRATPNGRRLEVRGDPIALRAIGVPEENLAYRAAAAYAAESGWPAGFAIEIDKRIPIGAGLGGGSADAGAVLRALDTLAPHPLPATTLLGIAARLGADVPFLASRHAVALAWGRGERLLALPPLPAADVVVLVPPFAVSTRDAFSWLDAERDNDDEARPAELSIEMFGRWDGIADAAGNDFSAVVFDRHPELADGARLLRDAGARIAQLSGSGATVFGIFPPNARVRGDIGADTRWQIIRTRTAVRVVEVVRLD